jgi:hypothetical protein
MNLGPYDDTSVPETSELGKIDCPLIAGELVVFRAFIAPNVISSDHVFYFRCNRPAYTRERIRTDVLPW